MVLVLVVGVHVAADGPAEQDGLLRDGRDAAAHVLRRRALSGAPRQSMRSIGVALQGIEGFLFWAGRQWQEQVKLLILRHLICACLAWVMGAKQMQRSAVVLLLRQRLCISTTRSQ